MRGREGLLALLGVPLAFAGLFLLIDQLLYLILGEKWHVTSHWLMAALLLAISLAALTIHQRLLARRAEARLRLSAAEESYRTLFDVFPEPYTVWSADGRLLMANHAAIDHLRGRREDLIGKGVADIFGPTVGRARLEILARVYQTRVPEERVEEVMFPGADRRVYWNVIQRMETPGNSAAVQIISYDITKRVAAEQALHAAEMARIQERTALEERQRLARELHDSVSQALYGIALSVNTALAVLDRDREAARDALNYTVSLTRAGLSEMRALIFALRPESLESEGLVVALAKQTEAMRARFELPVSLEACEEPSLPLGAKEALYRIAQEALRNAIKHAQAREIRVELTCQPGFLSLKVCDDGVGFDAQERYPGHLGLKSMRERAESVGGALSITSAPGAGAIVEARIPLHSE